VVLKLSQMSLSLFQVEEFTGLAGVKGLEPLNVGIKSRCLATLFASTPINVFSMDAFF